MPNIVEMKGLTKTFKTLNRHEGLKGSIRDLFSRDYKYLNAVDDININIAEGEIVGYLGPNGAGKSTTIKMMTGILEPTSGEIVVNGLIPYKNRKLNAQNIGVVFGQRSQLWWSLPVIESFKLLREIYKIDNDVYTSNLSMFDDIVDISKLYMKPVRQMSLGQRTLCDIVASFLHNPKIVFLDEPTIGLDVSMKSKIRDIIQKINDVKGTTIILTTHDIGDIEALCKRAIIIDKGKMVFDNDFEHLKNTFGKYRTLKLSVLGAKKRYDNITSAISEFEGVIVKDLESDDWIELLIDEEKSTLADVLSSCMKILEINDIKIEEIHTEDIIKKIYDENLL